MSRLFGTDGIRGVANSDLTCELAMAVGKATAECLTVKNGKTPCVVIGYDTRISSEMLASAISAGFCSVGCNVYILGIATTPAVAYLVGSAGADVGVMLSASHNSYEFNGIKIFSSNGFKLPDALEESIENTIFSVKNAVCTDKSRIGRILPQNTLLDKYISRLKSSADFDKAHLKAVFDCSNGGASVTADKVFSSLCEKSEYLFASPDGYNINKGCGSTNIKALREYVVNNGYDVGFAFDGDADRCLCIDENGDTVDGDDILAMCALDMKRNGRLKNNALVGTVMSNFGLSRFCNENGIAFVQSKVGDRYVLEEMLLNDYCIGGEQSGHIIFGDYATTGDGQLTAIRLMSLMERTGKKLSELKRVIVHFPQALINVPVTAEGKVRLYTDDEITYAVECVERELGNNGRILVRPSGTEPLIRVMTEGEDETQIKELASRVASIIKKKLS